MMSEPIQQSLHVACDVRHAFSVFTTRIDLWWPPGHRRFDKSVLEIEPHVGGKFVERSDTGEIAPLGEVLTFDPPHTFRYSWNPGKITGPTLIEVSFAAEEDGTRVDILHSEWTSDMGERWPERAAIFKKGWSIILPALAAHIAANPT